MRYPGAGKGARAFFFKKPGLQLLSEFRQGGCGLDVEGEAVPGLSCEVGEGTTSSPLLAYPGGTLSSVETKTLNAQLSLIALCLHC